MTSPEERKMYLSIGICPRCRKNPVEPNKHACYECLDYDKVRYRKSREDGTYKKQKADTERKRAIANQRREQGLCYKCGKRKAEGLCGICKAKAKAYKDKKRADISRNERPSYGFCYTCGKQELYDGHKVCKSCYDTRMKCMEAAWAKPSNEYFKELNHLIFVGGR